jgi:hypothetical protein
MKKTVIALLLIGSVIYAPQAKAFDCPAGQGTAVDLNVSTGVTTYSCIQLHHFDIPAAPAPVINTVTGQAPGTFIPLAPIVRVDTATVTAPKIDTPTVTAPITPAPVITSANTDSLLAALAQLINLITLMLQHWGLK